MSDSLYDPLPDVACVLANLYAAMPHDAPADSPPRRALRNLRDGLGIAHEHARTPLTWAQRLKEYGVGMPGTPAGDELTRRAERIAALEQRVRELEAAQQPATGQFVIPDGMSAHTAMQQLPDAQPGDTLTEASTGRTWTRTAHGTWARQGIEDLHQLLTGT